MNKRRNGGFTLIELLAVIGIILVLLSLLIPTLTHMRRRATRVSDLSNLRQFDTLCLLYAGDHDGFLPLGARDRCIAADGTIIPGSNDDMVWVNGQSFVFKLVSDYRLEKRMSSCTTYQNIPGGFYDGAVLVPQWDGATYLGWVYWARRTPRNRSIFNQNNQNTGISYIMPQRANGSATSRTLLTCMAFATSTSAWDGWFPHTSMGESSVYRPFPYGPFKVGDFDGLNMAYTDGGARWVPFADLGAALDIDYMYYDTKR
jgi:prepilin-type N-terminal cleavage/methylation domain-containing protein